MSINTKQTIIMGPTIQTNNLDKMLQSITNSVSNLEDVFCNAETQTKIILDNMKKVKFVAQSAIKKFQCIVDNLDLIIEGNEQTLDMLKISAKKFKVSEEDCVKQNVLSVTNSNRNKEKPYMKISSVENIAHRNIIKSRRRLSSSGLTSVFNSCNINNISTPKTDKRDHKKSRPSSNKENSDGKKDTVKDRSNVAPTPLKAVDNSNVMDKVEQSLNELFKEIRDSKQDEVECMSIISEDTLQLEITDSAHGTMDL